MKVKPIAFYLPQFHRTPENDSWWGEGFTEWTHVRNWKPLFEGHQIVRPHDDIGYYNLVDTKIRASQAKIAKDHGIYGFCYYHYWFMGERLLDLPLELMMNDRHPNIPFALCWANHDWNRRWDNNENELLKKQNYGDETEWEKHINFLQRFFDHKNYIRINDKPLFLIYQVTQIPSYQDRFTYWKHRYGDIEIVAVWGGNPGIRGNDQPAQHVDRICRFEPMRTLIRPEQRKIFTNNTVIMDAVSTYSLMESENTSPEREQDFRCVFPGWDNSPRVGNRTPPHIFINAGPSLLKLLLDIEISRSKTEYIFINAWNEWGEQAVLEPSDRYGYKNLEAVKAVANY